MKMLLMLLFLSSCATGIDYKPSELVDCDRKTDEINCYRYKQDYESPVLRRR